MIAHVEQPDGSFREEDRTPICEKHFCDSCGDCLGCDEGGSCFVGEAEFEHIWIIYLSDEE